jgi:hypothetical protein
MVQVVSIHMNTEHSNLLKSFQEGEWGRERITERVNQTTVQYMFI